MNIVCRLRTCHMSFLSLSGKLTIEIHRHDLHALAHALDRAVCLVTTQINLKMEIIVSITNRLASPISATHRTMVPIHEHVR